MFQRLCLITYIMLASIFFLECKKNIEIEEQYAVLISGQESLKYLSQKVFSVKKGIRKDTILLFPIDVISNKSRLAKLKRSQVLLFDSREVANYFLKKFEPYAFAYLESKKGLALREEPHFDSPEIGIAQNNTRLKIISPLLSPLDSIYLNQHKIKNTMYKVEIQASELRGYWIKVQYENNKSDSRAWVLITEKTILTTIETNPILNKFRDTLKVSDIWIAESMYNDSNFNYLDLPEESLQVSYSIPNQNIEALLLNKANTKIIIPVGQLWPVGPNSVINPTNNFLIELVNRTQAANKILISSLFESQNILSYVPKDIAIKMKSNFQSRIYDIYSILIDGNSSNNNFVYWYSNLFGKLSISKKFNPIYDYKIDVDWNMTDELFQSVFGSKATNQVVKGYLELKNIELDYEDESLDGALKYVLTNMNNTLYLAYKILDKQSLALKFIPQKGVKKLDNQATLVLSKPVAPTMVFYK